MGTLAENNETNEPNNSSLSCANVDKRQYGQTPRRNDKHTIKTNKYREQVLEVLS